MDFWCCTRLPNSGSGPWGWELQPGSQGAQTVVKGLVRIRKGEGIIHILTDSGRSFEGLRCFVDPLKWEDTSWNRQPFVSWVERLENESDSDYAARTARMATTGIAKGWKQLGMRTRANKNLSRKLGFFDPPLDIGILKEWNPF